MICNSATPFFRARSAPGMFETRKKEHEAKVRLTKRDIEDGNIESAEVRMGKEDGGLAKHSTQSNDQNHIYLFTSPNNP